MNHLSQSLNPRQRAWALSVAVFFALLAVAALLFPTTQTAQAGAGTITVEILAAPNLVVDSNASSPSTFAPSVATVAGKICNTSTTATVTQVNAYIGTHTGSGSGTPGIYPARNSATFVSTDPLYNTGSYALSHLGGSLGNLDASRYIGDLAPGQCVVQYWHFTYPQCSNTSPAWTFNPPPCDGGSIPVWGDSVKPEDDLWLNFDVWAKDASGSNWNNASHKVTMRNEISAMANKIQPNPDGRWFNTDNDTVLPGDIVTTNGILYELGVINQGFDNDGDLLPDFNAWMQPIGNAGYDPSCFRLISTHGVITVTRSGGNPDVVMPFVDKLYFSNLPSDNTGVRGKVYYSFLALTGPCSSTLSPYQEVASGYDNEKFNGDYGTGIPGVRSPEPNFTIDKSSTPAQQSPGGTVSYSIVFTNTATSGSLGMLTFNGTPVNQPLAIFDTIPAGTTLSGTPTLTCSVAGTILYSNDNRVSWSTTASGTVTDLQWRLNAPLPAGTSCTANFSVTINGVFTQPTPFVYNEACGALGGGTPLACDDTTTLVSGNNSIGDFVWRDLNVDGLQGGGLETGIANITVKLYYDANNNGVIDDADFLAGTKVTDANGAYSFPSLPNGRFLVSVDTLDADLPIGYAPTTPKILSYNLTGGTNITTADFGFGPSLLVDKHLDNFYAVYEGDLVTFHIDLYNTLSGDGANTGYCRYETYAQTYPAADGTPANGGNAQAQFENPTYALGRPNGTLATTNLANNADTISLSGFNMAGLNGNITSVKLVVYTREVKQMQDGDYIRLIAYRANGAVFTSSDYNGIYFGSPAGTDYIIENTLCSSAAACATAGWTAASFINDTAELQIYGNGSGGPANMGNMGIDAVKYVITTDGSCGGVDTTIDILPLADTYDPAKLKFVSASPAQTTLNETTGTITWANLGPLYAGGNKQVTVTFRALDPAAASATTTNSVSVTNAYYANGRRANDGSDSDNVTIYATGSIAGYIYSDTNNNGWQGTVGYESGTDNFIPGATVTLYGCMGTSGLITAPDKGKLCTAVGGTWTSITSVVTGPDGYYKFPNLREGFYYTSVTLPSWATGAVQSAEPVMVPGEKTAGGGTNSGLTCGTTNATCNGTWNPTGATTTATNTDLVAGNDTTVNFNPIGTFGSTPNEDIINVNFGYSSVPSRVYGKVYTDSNGDGTQDTGEADLSGVPVTLYRCLDAACTTYEAVSTINTAADGSYAFSNPTGGVNDQYFIQVTQPANTTQTADPDQPGVPCTTCDNTKAVFTLTAGQTKGSYDFGYQPSGTLTIGDAVYVDWNGDGDQDTGEEHITGVTVYLYEDDDGDGVIDPEDALIAMDETDSAGYSFTGLASGKNYIVKVDASDPQYPATYTQTGDPDQSGRCTTCNNTGSVLNLTSNRDNVDFGYQPRGYGTIGDFVWYDLDADGIQDSGEAGVPNVTINLYEDNDGDGVIDSEDALIASTTTLNYDVIDGYIDITGGGIGADDDLIGSNSLYGYHVYDGALDMNGDGSITTADDGYFGIYAVIDGRLDMNGSNTVTTDDDGSLKGFYLFKNLPPYNNLPADDFTVQVDPAEFSTGGDLVGYSITNIGDPYDTSANSYELTLAVNQSFYDVDFGFAPPGLIGDFFWRDSDGDGTQDPGEAGIPNVSLQLYTWSWTDSDNDGRMDESEVTISPAPIATTATDSTGYYEFGDLPPGNYLVRVDPAELASGGDLYGFTQTGDPDARTVPCSSTDPTPIDDDWWLICNHQSFVTLRPGQTDRSVDFGYKPPYSLGDFVWLDLNGDGNQDPGEAGIGGVTVTLVDCGPDLDCSTPGDNGAPVVTTTDSDGYYAFGGLQQRKYQVTVSGLPSGLAPTYDLDGIGTANVAEYTFTAPGYFDGMDFGYHYNGDNSISGTVFFDTGTLGGLYQSGTDNPIANVPVYLYDGTTLVGITYTDISGGYLFDNLPNGDFTVVVGSNSPQLANLNQTYEPDEAGDDGYCATGSLSCNNRTTVTLDGNEDVINQDFGFYANMDCGDLPETYNANGFDTKLGKEGPCHVRLASETNLVYLGARWDGEVDGQPNSTATGDDQAGGTNDEDGMVRNPVDLWTNGKTVRINVTVVGTNAYLAAWFDWNDDGDFVGTSVGADGKTESQREIVYYGLLAPGPHELQVTIPPASVGGCCASRSLMARFRLYEGQSPPAVVAPSGTVLNGEVEDYQWNFGPTAVEMISLEARVNPSGLPTWAWVTAAAVVGAGGLVSLRAWRKRH